MAALSLIRGGQSAGSAGCGRDAVTYSGTFKPLLFTFMASVNNHETTAASASWNRFRWQVSLHNEIYYNLHTHADSLSPPSGPHITYLKLSHSKYMFLLGLVSRGILSNCIWAHVHAARMCGFSPTQISKVHQVFN